MYALSSTMVLGSALCLVTNSCQNMREFQTNDGFAGIVQHEIQSSSTDVTLETEQATTVDLGLVAVNKLVGPTLGGKRLAVSLPTESVLRVSPDGTASFAYADMFSRHFRGREQHLIGPEGNSIPDGGDGIEDLMSLPVGAAKPKVLLDAHRLDVEGMVFNGSDDVLWWDGDLIYKFDFGHLVQAFRLSSSDDTLVTTVGDWDWQANGNPVEIFAATDGSDWVEIWRSSGEGGMTEVVASLPDSFPQTETVYLMFRGSENALLDLYISADLNASAVAPILSLETGATTLRYQDDIASSHHAVLFWEGMSIKGPTVPDAIVYPKDAPEVREERNTISVLFPERVGVLLERGAANSIIGMQDLLVDQHNLLSTPMGNTTPRPTLQMLDDGVVGDVTDWEAYLVEREANGGEWPARNGRAIRDIELSSSVYTGHRIEGNSVVLTTMLTDGDATGTLEWVFTPTQMRVGDQTHRGVGWKIRVNDLPQAKALRVIEPATARYGGWTFAQHWGNFIEAPLDFSTPFQTPERFLFADIQAFFFATHPDGTVTSYFDTPVAAQVQLAAEAGRILNTMIIPLSAGSVHETPTKFWLWNATPVATKWEALDAWTAVFDAVTEHYREPLGLGQTDPEPTVAVLYPKPEYMQQYLNGGLDAIDEFYFDELARVHVPTLAGLGFRNLNIEAQWVGDADYPTEEYPPGSQGFGSAHAPWHIEVSKALGGETGLAALTSQAHEVDVNVVLWATPAHLSNSSPLLQQHPDWLMWSRDGTPEVSTYGDIVGTSLRSGFYEYAVGQFEKIHQNTGFDGFWIDSFLTFGILEDYSRPHPVPQLDRTLAMQRALWKMGMTQILIEGCGPFGVSTGAYGAEAIERGGPDEQAEGYRRFERIRGREYGLFRYMADMLVEPQSYYRTLASKGVVIVFSLNMLNRLSEAEQAQIAQANADYNQMLDRMETRHLIATGDTWQGVSWTKSGSNDVVVFAFETFHVPLLPGATVLDITDGLMLKPGGDLNTASMHTYLIRNSAAKAEKF